MPIQYTQFRINKNPDGAASSGEGGREGTRCLSPSTNRHGVTDVFISLAIFQTINNKMISVWRSGDGGPSHHGDGRRADKDKNASGLNHRLGSALSLKVVAFLPSKEARQAIQIIRLVIKQRAAAGHFLVN